MHKAQIQAELIKHHQSFIAFVNSLPDEDFVTSTHGKWTPGEQLQHMYLSVRPVRLALSLPCFVPALIWGTANRRGRSYEALIEKYQQKLEAGGRATPAFIPKTVGIAQRKALSALLQKEVDGICRMLEKIREASLDKYILPHPLLGKLSFREMLYFTIYHVQHHEAATKQNLEQ